MMVFIDHDRRTIKPRVWCLFTVIWAVMGVVALDGPNVCMVKQKYNITRLVKYRAPMSVRTYEWCFSMPPRCSKWNTEMRDLTRRETEERTAEVAVCCPGYKMQDVSCVPICPNGKTGAGCSEDCPDNKWGPNCIHDCQKCRNGFCSPLTGECECLDGWQGESCDTSMPTTTSTTTLEELLTTHTNKPTSPNTTPRAVISTTIVSIFTTPLVTSLPRKTTESVTRPPTTSTVTTLRTPSTLQTTTTAVAIKPEEYLITSTEPSRVVKTTDVMKTTEGYTKIPVISISKINNTTVVSTTEALKPIEEVTRRIIIKPIYNKTEVPIEVMTEAAVAIKTVQVNDNKQKPLDSITTTEVPKLTTVLTTKETTLKIESAKKDTTARIFPTTVKFKPKEIWIRPAQKGESPIIEAKVKSTHESPRYRSANKDSTPTNTTPKTIIVSIIPTSVSYSTFKKIALTTASILSQRNITNAANKREHEHTKPMPKATTSMPQTIATTRKYINSSTSVLDITTIGPTLPPTITTTHKPSTHVTKRLSTTETAIFVTNSMKNATVFLNNITNSMVDINITTSSTSATISTNARIPNQNNPSTKTHNVSSTPETVEKANHTAVAASKNRTNTPILHRTNKPKDKITSKIKETEILTPKDNDTTVVTPQGKVTETVTNAMPPNNKLYTTVTRKDFKKTNVTKLLTKSSTDEPIDDEEFHILTEPEHITAVMGDKGADRSSVDLVSVISIAGGVMMAVITVAVIIVMVERCKKPRYEDVRKINDIRMQVMIDNDVPPPPYVRSIFHTPLPDPPTSEKCHYQPISTLDRNLKQFMRPVVVQTISPIMLENFRGILECHYDHLPRRSHDFGPIQTRCSIAPSLNDCSELRHLRASVTESTIEALKCEAKCDMIDTTSEPLYAEIPCWRPPSEHAVEIMNLNGEAVTEL